MRVFVLAAATLLASACAVEDGESSAGADGTGADDPRGVGARDAGGRSADAALPGDANGSETPQSPDATVSGGEGAESAELSGHLRAGVDAPTEGFRVNLCSDICRTGFVAADGTYAVPKADPLTHLLEIWPGATGPHAGVWLAPSFPVTLGVEEQRTLDLLWLPPDTHADLPATAAEVEIAEGVFVTIGRDTAKPTLYLTGEFTEVYGVRFPDADRPPIEGVGEPLAFWVVGPADTEALGEGFPVRFANRWSLPDGAPLQVWHAELQETGAGDLQGEWVWDGEVTVMGDVIVGAARLPKLGSILLSR